MIQGGPGCISASFAKFISIIARLTLQARRSPAMAFDEAETGFVAEVVLVVGPNP